MAFARSPPIEVMGAALMASASGSGVVPTEQHVRPANNSRVRSRAAKRVRRSAGQDVPDLLI
jgi:hypothetical protein